MDQYFETVIMLKPDITKKDLATFKRVYLDLLQGYSTPFGKRVSLDDIGKKNLAYVIRGYTEGYYLIFKYCANDEKIAELKNSLRSQDSILKFLTVKHENGSELEDLIAADLKSEQKKPVIDIFDLIFDIK